MVWRIQRWHISRHGMHGNNMRFIEWCCSYLELRLRVVSVWDVKDIACVACVAKIHLSVTESHAWATSSTVDHKRTAQCSTSHKHSFSWVVNWLRYEWWLHVTRLPCRSWASRADNVAVHSVAACKAGGRGGMYVCVLRSDVKSTSQTRDVTHTHTPQIFAQTFKYGYVNKVISLRLGIWLYAAWTHWHATIICPTLPTHAHALCKFTGWQTTSCIAPIGDTIIYRLTSFSISDRSWQRVYTESKKLDTI